MPELLFIVGCNAAGKSTFIRTRLAELEDFEILMTDVYKARTRELAIEAISDGKNVLIETVFNDASFKDIVNFALKNDYKTSLVVLFLDSIQHSIDRVAFRSMQQSGLAISGDNIRINFNESFKNIANFFIYFDRTDFVYTGKGNVNRLIMSFHNDHLVQFFSNDLNYPQQFAKYSFAKKRLEQQYQDIILKNHDYKLKSDHTSKRTRFKL